MRDLMSIDNVLRHSTEKVTKNLGLTCVPFPDERAVEQHHHLILNRVERLHDERNVTPRHPVGSLAFAFIIAPLLRSYLSTRFRISLPPLLVCLRPS